EATQAVLAFPDVVSASIYTDKRKLLYREGQQGEAEMPLWPEGGLEYRETDQAWHFAQPVFAATAATDGEDSPFVAAATGAERIGYVHVTITKKTLTAMSQEILRTNLIVSIALASLLLLLLLLITGRLT